MVCRSSRKVIGYNNDYNSERTVAVLYDYTYVELYWYELRFLMAGLMTVGWGWGCRRKSKNNLNDGGGGADWTGLLHASVVVIIILVGGVVVVYVRGITTSTAACTIRYFVLLNASTERVQRDLVSGGRDGTCIYSIIIIIIWHHAVNPYNTAAAILI